MSVLTYFLVELHVFCYFYLIYVSISMSMLELRPLGWEYLVKQVIVCQLDSTIIFFSCFWYWSFSNKVFLKIKSLKKKKVRQQVLTVTMQFSIFTEECVGNYGLSPHVRCFSLEIKNILVNSLWNLWLSIYFTLDNLNFMIKFVFIVGLLHIFCQ